MSLYNLPFSLDNSVLKGRFLYNLNRTFDIYLLIPIKYSRGRLLLMKFDSKVTILVWSLAHLASQSNIAIKFFSYDCIFNSSNCFSKI